jgi:glycosyltransferase involved in cell wall biosynthesis
VVVHSSAAADRAAALGIERARVAVIPIPADEPARAGHRRAARAELDLPPGAPLVLFFGHVRPYKGLGVLLDALPAIVHREPAVRLVVAGPVAGGGRGVAALRRSVARRGMGEWVALRPGYVPHERVDDYFAAADVVALPYRATDDSAVLATARGHGRAVVASAVGGLPEALASGGGILVPPRDPVALADAVLRLLTDPAERRRLEAEALAAARSWTWADAAARTREVYESAREERR